MVYYKILPSPVNCLLYTQRKPFCSCENVFRIYGSGKFILLYLTLKGGDRKEKMRTPPTPQAKGVIRSGEVST